MHLTKSGDKRAVTIKKFKNCVPGVVSTYLSEKRAKIVEESAVFADDHVLVHKVAFSDKFQPKTKTHILPQHSHFSCKVPCGSSTPYVSSGSKASSSRNGSSNRTSFYCKKPGYIVADCPALSKKQKPEPVALIGSVIGQLKPENESGKDNLSVSSKVFDLALCNLGVPAETPLQLGRVELVTAPRADPSLTKCFAVFKPKEELLSVPVSFYVEGDVLMHKWTFPDGSDWSATYQVVIPCVYCSQILNLAHDNAVSGHLGIRKTYNQILKHFFWPGLKAAVLLHLLCMSVSRQT